MNLGLKNVSKAIHILKNAPDLEREKLFKANLSLPSALALFAQRQATYISDEDIPDFLAEFNHTLLCEAEACLSRKIDTPSTGSVLSKRTREMYLIESDADLLSDKFDYFCTRFRKSITKGNRSSGYMDLQKAFFEMSDNVSHAGVKTGSGCFGIAAYESYHSGGCFTVCDNGCGFVKSLTKNIKWKSIKTHQEAIDAVVMRQATSRSNEETGGGFKNLFSALVQINAQTILRSGDWQAEITMRANAPNIVFHPSILLAGSQISVMFSTQGIPGEIFS